MITAKTPSSVPNVNDVGELLEVCMAENRAWYQRASYVLGIFWVQKTSPLAELVLNQLVRGY